MAYAQRIAGIDDFLKPIVSKIAKDPDLERWTWKDNRNGGYLLRRFVDVNGDGRSEAFIVSTLESAKYVHVWHVFNVGTFGSMKPYEKTLRHYSAVPVKEDGKTCLLELPGPDKERMRISDPNPYPVHRYSFVFPKIEEVRSWVSEEEHISLEKDYERRLPQMEAILLADYLNDPAAEWSVVAEGELKMDAADCYYLEESKERAEKNKAFTPQVALVKLASLR